MPSVEPLLRPGATFNLTADEAAENVWFKVPDWLAGTWSMRREATVYHQDFRTGKVTTDRKEFEAHTSFTYGHQRDREGGFWHYVGTPYTSRTELADFVEYHQVSEKELVQSDEKRAVIRTRVTVIRTDTATNTIVRTFQQESITTYTRLSRDELKLTSSTKVFDDTGQAAAVVENEGVVHRMSPFTETDFASAKNLKELFVHFLLSHQLANLIPDQL